MVTTGDGVVIPGLSIRQERDIVEFEVIKPMLHKGHRVEPSEDGDNPVIDLPVADGVYLEGIGRVRRIVVAEPVVEENTKPDDDQKPAKGKK